MKPDGDVRRCLTPNCGWKAEFVTNGPLADTGFAALAETPYYWCPKCGRLQYVDINHEWTVDRHMDRAEVERLRSSRDAK
jgi:hypothetical protein